MMVTLANEFAGRGIDTDLVVANCEGPFRSDIRSEVRVVDLGVSRALTSLAGLVQYLRREKLDGVLSTLAYANVVAATAHLFAGSDARLVMRETNSLSGPDAEGKSIKERIIRWMSFPAYTYADEIVGISEGLYKDIVENIKVKDSKVSTVYNPVKIRDRNKAENKTDGRKIVSAGRLVRQKGFSVLISAFETIDREIEADLIILGEGEERENLEELARDLGVWEDVYMPGFVEDPFGHMDAASVFVLSSRWEGFGNVLVEAMACGTPVVSTDCPSGPAEILEGGKWGHLVPVGDEKALAEAVLETLNDPPVESDRLIERAKDFSVGKIADQYLEVLLEN